MNDMNKLEFFKLIKEITEVSNLDELKNLVIKANNFVKENDIKKGSEEFEKFVKVIDITAVKTIICQFEYAFFVFYIKLFIIESTLQNKRLFFNIIKSNQIKSK
jgi:ribosomal protein L7/L12